MQSWNELVQKRPTGTNVKPLPEAYSFEYDERSEPYKALFESLEQEYGIPKGILPGMAKIESDFNPKTIGPMTKYGTAKGMMQLLDGTAKELGVKDVFDPEQNIRAGAKYLKQNYDRFGDWTKAVAAHNMGPSNVEKYGPRGLKETAGYLDKLEGVKASEATSGMPSFEDLMKSRPGTPVAEPSAVKPEVEKASVGTYYSELAGDLTMTGSKLMPLFHLPKEKERYHGVTGEWGPEYGISKDDSDNFITRGIKKFIDIVGSDVEPTMSDAARAQAVVELSANEEGVPLHEYRQSPELIEKAASSFTSMATFGVLPAVREATTGERDFKATDISGHAGYALGSLGGLIFGPAKAAERVFKPVLDVIPRFTREAPVAVRVISESLRDAVILGPAMGLASLGEAGKSLTFSQAASHIWEGTKSGALTGVIFGASRGMFPAEGVDKAARLATGLIGLNALRVTETGGNPFTNRPIGEVMFDTLLDVAFLWRGLPKGEFSSVEKEVANLSKEAADLKVAEQAVEQTADEATKQVYKQVLEAKKKQFELRSDQLANRISEDVLVREELSRQAEEVAKAKMRPVAETGLKEPTKTQVRAVMDKLPEGSVPEFTFESKKGNKYVKVGEQWYDESGVPVTNAFKIKAAEKGKVGVGEEKVPEEVRSDIAQQAIDDIEAGEGKSYPSDAIYNEIDSLLDPQYESYFEATKTPKGIDDTVGRLRDNIHNKYGSDKVEVFDKALIDLQSEGMSKKKAIRLAYWEASKPKLDIVRSKIEQTPEPEPEPITEVDQQTGRDITPEERTTTFDATKKETLALMKSFVQNPKSVAKYFDDLLPDQGGSGLSPYTYLRKLQNDVNRWKHGDKRVNIENIQKRISELSERVNELRNEFPDDINDFVAFKETVSETAKWARELDRSKIERTQAEPRELEPAGEGYLNAEEINKLRIKREEGSFDRMAQRLGNQYGVKYLGQEDAITTGKSEKPIVLWSLEGDSRVFRTNGLNITELRMKSDYLKQQPKPPGGGGVRLNMMIPLDEIPGMVQDLIVKGGKGVKDLVRYLKRDKLTLDKLYRNKEIFDKTGFWLGKDGKWRYEIDDTQLNFYPGRLYSTSGVRKKVQLGDVLEYPDLFKEFPEAKVINVSVDSSMPSDKALFNLDTNEIVMGSAERSALLHEIQHWINNRLGAFEGGSPEGVVQDRLYKFFDSLRKSAKSSGIEGKIWTIERQYFDGVLSNKGTAKRLAKAIGDTSPKKINSITTILDDLTWRKSAVGDYLKVPGEMEARLTEKRMSMSSEQRKKEYPWKTLDEMLTTESLKYDFSYEHETVGTKLYSGIPLDEMQKHLSKLYDRAKAYGEKSSGMKDFKPLEAVKALRKEFTRAFIERSGNIRRELLDQLGEVGYKIVQAMYLARGSSSMAAKALKQMRKEIYSGLDRKGKALLDDLIFHTRMIDLGQYKTEKDFKYFKEHPVEESIAVLGQFREKEGLTAAEAHSLYHVREDGSIGGRVGTYFDWMKRVVDDLYEGGLISAEEQAALKAHNYRRLKIVDIFDHRYKPKKGARTVYDSGVESLAKGRDTDIFERSSEVMALEVLNRAYGRIMNNRANMTLLELARGDKDNPFVRVKENPGDIIPTGWNRIFVFEGGKRKALYLSPEMSKEWITSNPDMSYRQSQLIRYVSGSPVLRTFATGINWGFALANLPKDVMHTWYAARVFENGKWKPIYNPNLPIFSLQIGRDLATTFSDALLRKGRYNEYLNEGGGMEFLVHQGRLFQRGRHIEGNLDKIYDFLGYFGETSEIMTRLAIRERVLRRRAKEKGITVEKARRDKDIAREATFAARDYMDFGQGGWATKAADNAVPYLNATVVGGRGLWRAFKDNPIESTYKLAQFATVVTGAYIAMNKLAPMASKALRGNIDMQNNLCIPLGDYFSYEDEKGQTRYMYLKIPLDPGQKFFKTFFEASADKWLGNPVDVNRVIDSLKEQSPVSVTELPPTLSGAIGYATNKDFWLNEDIWKRTEKPFSYPQSKEEYIPGQTPQAYIDLGEFTGLSPERTRYAVEELVTNGTIWSYLMGKGYDAAFGDLPKEQKEQHVAEVLNKMPVVKRFFGVTNPYSQFAGSIEKAREESSLKRFKQTRGLDALVDGYLFKGNVKKEEIRSYIKSFKDPDVAERLTDRFLFQVSTKDLPNRVLWKRLQDLDTEARAKVFRERWDTSNAAEKVQIRKEFGTVDAAGGVITEDFLIKVGKLN